MIEKPISFSTDMIKLILNSKKTQTRRIIKNIENENYLYSTFLNNSFNVVFAKNKKMKSIARMEYVKCPYKIGMKLWVRETWCINSYHYHWTHRPVMYKSECKDLKKGESYNDKIFEGWKSSLSMPKKYARIWLQITNIRVEKFNKISDSDIFAEGFKTREDFYNCIIKIYKKYDDILNRYCWIYDFKKS